METKDLGCYWCDVIGRIKISQTWTCYVSSEAVIDVEDEKMYFKYDDTLTHNRPDFGKSI